MQGEFEMSMMGELNYFLGLQIKQGKDGTFINQAKYTKELIKKFKMENAKAYNTPMSSSIKLDKDEKGKNVDEKLYRGMIGSLLYLTASRPCDDPELKAVIREFNENLLNNYTNLIKELQNL